MRIFAIIFVLLFGCCLASEQGGRFVLESDHVILGGSPLCVDVSSMGIDKDGGEVILYRLDGGEKVVLDCQLEAGVGKLWFMAGRDIEAGEKVVFEVGLKKEVGDTKFKVEADGDDVTVCCGGKKVVSYYYGLCDVVEGVDKIYRKSGFIHPLYSPAGKVLTRIQPGDHYHHYGIWGPWTRTKVEGKEVDFWNLAEGQGAVRFGGFVSKVWGDVFGGVKVRQEHVVKAGNKTAINEVWDIKAFGSRIADKQVWIVDVTEVFNNALDSVIEFEQYRYGGGLGFRANKEWVRDNSWVLTSEGKTRKDADGSRARWCDVGGEIDGRQCGVLFLSHRGNREHPEPMRVWPEGANGGRGDVFFEFCPIRHKNWMIEPGKEYVLKYRMIVYDGRIEPEVMETLWKNYVYQPVVTIK